MATTKISDLINPQVMADMISAKVEKKIVVAPFAKVDTTLQGIPGNTITVPKYGYIGDAEDVAEGVQAGTVKLSTGTTTATVKKAMKAVELTDEAVLSGYGNPVGETNEQLAKAIASKVDTDAMDALKGATLTFDGTANKIGYAGIVDAVDVFGEEVNSEKAIFVHPAQVTTLRKDTDFLSADKYKEGVILSGEIGLVANCRVVPSKKVQYVGYEKDNTNGTITIVADSTQETSTKFHLDHAQAQCLDTLAVGDKIKALSVPYYRNPIIKLNNDAETEEDAAAITIYLKRDTNVETERDTLARKTDISVDKHYCVALSNESKVVLAKFKA